MKLRRKAIDCKLIGESKTSPGYYKYAVTIQEKDSSINTIPCYGYDMQDAIRRLIHNERSQKVVNIINRNEWTFTLLWLIAVIIPFALGSILQKPALDNLSIIPLVIGLILLVYHAIKTRF